MAVSMIDLENRVRTIEQRSSLGSGPSLRFKNAEYEPNIPQAENIQILATFNEDGVTTVVLGWIVPDDPKVETFEIWVKDITNEASGIVKMAETREPPATLVLQSDATTAKTLIVRTRMRSGVGSALNASPTATAEIRKLEVGELSLADGAVTTNKIADFAVTNAKIGNASISTAKIQTAAITTALIQDAAITNAKILNLDAAKINAGTINSVNVNAGTYTLIAGFQQMLINGTNGFFQANTSASSQVRIFNGQVTVERTTSGSEVTLDAFATGGGISFTNSSGILVGLASATGLGGQANSGGLFFANSAGTSRVVIGINGSGNGHVTLNGQQIITNRQSTVSDPSGGGTQDAEARTAINAIIDRLQAHGLIS